MSILSEDIITFVPVKDRYWIGCYINDITKIVGGPDTTGHFAKDKKICNRLCHQVVDAMMEWGCGLLRAEDLRPLLNTFMKEPQEHYIDISEYGMETSINVMAKHAQRHIMKIVLSNKEWVA